MCWWSSPGWRGWSSGSPGWDRHKASLCLRLDTRPARSTCCTPCWRLVRLGFSRHLHCFVHLELFLCFFVCLVVCLLIIGSHFQNFLVYMFFLLVVLILNYSDSTTHSLRLRTQLQRALHTPEYHNISRYAHTHTHRGRASVVHLTAPKDVMVVEWEYFFKKCKLWSFFSQFGSLTITSYFHSVAFCKICWNL